MTAIVAAALGIAVAVPPVPLALALGALAFPVPTAVVTAVLLLAGRPARPEPPSVRLAELAAASRAGAALREAVARVLPDRPARLLRAGIPWNQVSEDIDHAFGVHGPAVRTAVSLLSRHGGPPAGVFAELASRAVVDEMLESERSAGAAPGVAQAAVIGGVPAAVLVHAAVTGRFARLAGLGPPGAVLAWGGAAATVIGAAMVLVMLWSARR